MFFSKLILPIVAVFSVATAVFATPLAISNVDLAKRAASADALATLQSFHSQVMPMIDALGNAGSSGADSTAALNALSSAFTTSTQSFKSKGANVLVAADVNVFISVSLDIILKLVASINLFVFVKLAIAAKVDIFLSAWINALDVVHANISAQIGAAIPILDLNIFASLQLILSAKVLVIIDLLGIIIL